MILLSDAADDTRSCGECSVPSVLLSDQCLSGRGDRKAQLSPTPSAGYLGKFHTGLKQTNTLVRSQPHTNKLPCVRQKWDQLYAIKSVITA